MAVSVVYLLSRDAVVNSNGDYVGPYNTGTGRSTYIPIAAGRIEFKINRTPMSLPIPVFGITAVIDYNSKKQFYNITDIILAEGGNSILGRTSKNGTKGWVVDGMQYHVGGSPVDLADKEVQRALLSRALGMNWRDEIFVDPSIKRIMWGNPGVANPVTAILTIASGAKDFSFTRVVSSNITITNAKIAEVAGEPTKYECEIEAEVGSFLGSDAGISVKETVVSA